MSTVDLADRYARRRDLAAAHAETGAPVVGIVGRDVPAVLVEAAGGAPFRIAAEPGDPAEAEGYLGRSIDHAALAVAAAALDGRLDFLRGILIAHDCEASVRLFYALRELHRRGRVRVPVHLVDQVHLSRESTLRFNTAQLIAMTGTVTGWTGSAVTRTSLATAWERHGALRAALDELRAARRGERGPDGREVLHAYGVATAAPRDGSVDAIRDAARRSRPRRSPDRLPVLLTGSAPIGDALYGAVESAGAVIVGEDHDWGDPILSDLLPVEPPLDIETAASVCARSRLDGAPASASAPMAARAGATAAAIARSGARALLGVLRPHDDAPAWDWSRQRIAAGVPSALVRGADAVDPGAIRAALATLGASA